MKKLALLLLALALIALVPAVALAAPTAPSETPQPEFAIRFSTTDREGNEVDESVLAGHKAVMLNFWEPWCPPCVGEMPDLARLYEAYEDKGLLILGIYSTDGMEEQVDAVLEKSGTGYPILHYTAAFDDFQTGYVPTTVILDGEGNALTELLIGSRSYESWEEILLKVLQ